MTMEEISEPATQMYFLVHGRAKKDTCWGSARNQNTTKLPYLPFLCKCPLICWARSVKQELCAILLVFLTTIPAALPAAPPRQQPSGAQQLEQADLAVKGLRYSELETLLATMPDGVDRTYFEGILANRAGEVSRSERLLNQAIPALHSNERKRTALAIAALADDYLKLFRYRDAASQYSILLTRYPGDIDSAVLDSIKDDFGAIQLMADYPPQQIEKTGGIRLKTVHSPIGTFDTVLQVNGVQSPWILDTGANFSLVSASLARQLGVKVSEKTAQTKGGTNGLENIVHVGLLPKIELGGAVIHNMVLLIFDDRSLKITYGPNISYQIQALLGYPVFQALGSASFTSDGYFVSDSSDTDTGAFSRMFMNKLTPLVEAGVEGKKLLFTFDTGANGSELTKRYYDAFPEQFRKLPLVSVQVGGAGGTKNRKLYRLPQLSMEMGGQRVVLHDVPVVTSLYGTELDASYGNLGRDITAPFASFTVDFSKMRFSLGKPLSPP